MIIIALRAKPGRERPFAVAKIVDIDEKGLYLVHWHGHLDNKVEGTYRKGWRVPERGSSRAYYAPQMGNEEGAYAFTSERAGMTVKRNNIKHFGFQLTYNDRLPVKLVRAIEARGNSLVLAGLGGTRPPIG